MKNVLFLTDEAPNYGPDLLYHGFANLPDVTVWDYPSKASYHGGKIEDKFKKINFNTPMCVFDVKGLGQELKDGKYDLVIGDTRTRPEWVELACQYTPTVLYDGDDYNGLRIKQELFDKCKFVFKREYYKDLYGLVKKIVPLPFGYPGEDTQVFNKERKIAVSYMGCATNPLRIKMYEWLRQFNIPEIVCELTIHPNTPRPHDYYTDILNQSEIAISIIGGGMDTFRHWEIPAHGTALLSLTLPIEIPNGFENRKEAIYGDNIKELIDLLIYYARHMDETREIAAAGRKALFERHLTTHRAQRVLETVGL